jgi:hypothetical protein
MSPRTTTRPAQGKGPSMEELLFGLTPAEFWVWNYLVLQARRQRSNHVILPKPGEDEQLERVYSRKQVKNILKALKVKRTLTHIIIPRSKSKQIELFLPASKIGEISFPNREKGSMNFPNKDERGCSISPITGLGKSVSPISNDGQRTFPDSAAYKLELKEKIKRLLKQKQGQLKKELGAMAPKELVELGKVIKGLCRYEPKGKKLSLEAKVYAVMRFIQEGEAISKPQAWIDTVARQGQRDFEEARWGTGVKDAPGQFGHGTGAAQGGLTSAK